MKSKNAVFYISLGISLIMIALGVMIPERVEAFSKGALGFIYDNLGWFILGAVLVFFLFCMYLAVTRFGHIRLGDDQDRPEYSTVTWVAMLFSASIGISLVFWGVAEPVSYYVSPPIGEGYTQEAAKTAMQYVYLHWGVSAWACYALVGVSLAYFQFRKKLPASLSSVFYPLVGDRIYGAFGKWINVLVIFSVVIGIATSLGFGTLQVNSGLNILWGVPVSTQIQFFIIAIVSIIYISSTISGLQGAMKYLSNLNMLLAFALLGFVLVLGPTQTIFKVLFQGIGDYAQNFINMSLRTEPYGNGEWIANWTLFYFGWWIAWSPLVGSFVARISRGRTIREFMIGAVFIPVLGSFFWFAVMGGSAIHIIQNLGQTALASVVSEDVTSAFFVFLENFPYTTFTSILTIVLVMIFFITSANSALFVLGMVSENGNPNPSHRVKIIWGLVIGAISSVLIVSGGLAGLQSALVSMSIPLAVMMLVMCISTYKGLKSELKSLKITDPDENLEVNAVKHAPLVD